MKSVTAVYTQVIDQIKQCDFFKFFPESEMASLAQVTNMISLESNVKLLSQGEVCHSIFFLLKGCIGIYINGEKVSKLQRKGDLIGEMNMVDQRPSTATLITELPSELLKINVEAIKKLPLLGVDYFDQNIYKYYAIMLTEKLEQAVDKTKQFELVIRHLRETQAALETSNDLLENKVKTRTLELEQQNAALIASHIKLEEIYQTRDTIFEKLGGLTKDNLKPLQSVLSRLGPGATSDDVKLLRKTERIIDELIEQLAPLSFTHKKEKAIRDQRILLVEKEAKTKLIMKMALGGTGVCLDHAMTLEEAEKLLSIHQYNIICTSAEFISINAAAKNKNPHIKSILMMDEQHDFSYDDLAKYPFINNIVSKNVDNPNFNVKNILTTITKLVNKDIFGLEKYLSWGAEVRHLKVESSGQRRSLIVEMDEYFKAIGIRSAVRENMNMVAEELLMNMIYDAPTDEKGVPKYNHLDRSIAVQLKENEQGFFRYGCDGTLAAISAVDPFGGLKRETIFGYLQTCAEGVYGKMNREQNKGGAGMGLFQIFKCSDLIVYNVRSHKKTEVIAFFNLDPKQINKERPASLHFFAD